MTSFMDYRDHTGTAPEKFFKSTLAESPRLLLGLNPHCMAPLNGPVDPSPKDLPAPILRCNPMARYAVRQIIP